MIRFYILPVERNVINSATYRGPKYFNWNQDPDPPGINCKWSLKDYGSIDMGMLAADISQADHDALILNADIYAFPENLSTVTTVAQRQEINTFIEAHGIPGDWLGAGMTFAYIAKTITSMMLYNQRVCAILGYPANPYSGLTLNTRYSNIPNPLHDAFPQAASDLGFTWSVGNNDQVRKLLKMMADQWGTAVIHFGFTEL